MTTQILLALFLISYGNLVTFNSLKQSKAITTFKEYFKYDEGSLVFTNLMMVFLSVLIIVISEVSKTSPLF